MKHASPQPFEKAFPQTNHPDLPPSAASLINNRVITVEEAEQLIADSLETLPSETVSIEDALGRVLRETLRADRNAPPFNRSTFDGIALSYAAIEQGRSAFPITGTAFAGSPRLSLDDSNACVEIMTGAPLPDQADCVVKVEDLDIVDGTARIREGTPLDLGHGVHPEASDCQAGQVLLEPGCQLTAKELSIAASIGKAELLVSQIPRISIFTTGDELVPIAAQPLPHQIRRSNDLALDSALASTGYVQTRRFHILDDLKETESVIASILEQSDIIILAGGISKGKRDFLPEALETAGVSKSFQWVAQRPGKPLWFGDYTINDRKSYVFALPGNPVSCFTCLHRYVLPALDQLCGLPARAPQYAKLKSEFQFKPPITLFIPVLIEYDANGQTWAEPLPFNTSGDYISVARTQGFIELPQNETQFVSGSAHRFRPWQT
jgi:molybdopterin molybdotransferase